MVELLKKDNEGRIEKVVYYTSRYDKKDNTVKVVVIDEFNIFKCTADHLASATLIQNVVSSRELSELNKTIIDLEEKELMEFGLSDEDNFKLNIARVRKDIISKVLEGLAIPTAYQNKPVTAYPQNELLVANWLGGKYPKFEIEKLKTLMVECGRKFINDGELKVDEVVTKDVKDAFNNTIAKIYSTVKDSIHKKWNCEFTAKNIREIIWSCGTRVAVVNGSFDYQLVSDDEIRRVLTHAILRRMQRDNAEVDTANNGKTDSKTEGKKGRVTVDEETADSKKATADSKTNGKK